MDRLRASLLSTMVLACPAMTPACSDAQPVTSSRKDGRESVAQPVSERAAPPPARGAPAYFVLGDHRLLRLDDDGWAQVWNAPLQQTVVAPDGTLTMVDDETVMRLSADGPELLLRRSGALAGADEIDLGRGGALWLLDHDEPATLLRVDAKETTRWDAAAAGLEAHALLGMTIDGDGRPWLVHDSVHGIVTLADDGERWRRLQGWALRDTGDEVPLQDWGVAADGRPYALLGGELLRIGEGGVEARLRVGDDDEQLTMAFDRVGAAVLVSGDRCRLWTIALPAMTPGTERVLPACDQAWLSAFDDRGRSWFVAEDRRAIVVGAAGEVHEYSLPGTGDERLEDIDVIGRGPALHPDTIVAPVADTAFAHPGKKSEGGEAPDPRAATTSPPPPPSFGPERAAWVHPQPAASLWILADPAPALLPPADAPSPERTRYRSVDDQGVVREGIRISDGHSWWTLRVASRLMVTPRCDCARNLAQPADAAEPLRWTQRWLELQPDNETGDDGWRPLDDAPSPPRCAVAPPVQDSWPLAVAGSRLFAVEHRAVPGCGPQPERLARLWITDLAHPTWDADASEALLTTLFHELPGSVVDDARARAATALGVDLPHDLELLALHPRADALVLLFGTPRPREAGGAGGWDDLTGEFMLSLPLPASSSLTAPAAPDLAGAPDTWGDPWTPIGWSTARKL